jgi:FkbM family methyltransferase
VISTLRRVRRRFLPAHIRADIRDTELLVAMLEELLEPDSDCLDVGAHAGSVLREIVRLAPRGRHVAWEPLPEFAARMRAEFPDVEVREAALGNAAGERSFAHVLEDPGWSGFLARPMPSASPVQKLDVQVERLDDVLPDGVRPAFVKVDVEGAEEEVLLGARETLRRHRPVVAFEHGRGSADHYGTTSDAIHNLLAELGYEISGLDGDGPYDVDRFAELFASGERVNFVARPVA